MSSPIDQHVLEHKSGLLSPATPASSVQVMLDHLPDRLIVILPGVRLELMGAALEQFMESLMQSPTLHVLDSPQNRPLSIQLYLPVATVQSLSSMPGLRELFTITHTVTAEDWDC
jgi:hypothetical protein